MWISTEYIRNSDHSSNSQWTSCLTCNPSGEPNSWGWEEAKLTLCFRCLICFLIHPHLMVEVLNNIWWRDEWVSDRAVLPLEAYSNPLSEDNVCSAPTLMQWRYHIFYLMNKFILLHCIGSVIMVIWKKTLFHVGVVDVVVSHIDHCQLFNQIHSSPHVSVCLGCDNKINKIPQT